MIDATMTKRMEEATRLTRAGKLQEAMAVLQGNAPESSGVEMPDTDYQKGNIFDGTCEVIDDEATESKPEPAKSSAGAFTPGDIKVPDAWRDKWMKFRAGIAQPEQVPSASETPQPGEIGRAHV